ncbi:hypothetical protein [Trinickia soli]|uniref:hypothetical protein n=1 Tax=Trinickia soli TaxID=380675 RepID=UPI003FA3D3E3
MAVNIPTLPPVPASIDLGLPEPSKAPAAGQGLRSSALPSAGGQLDNLKTLGRRGGSGSAKSAAKYDATPEPSTGQARGDGKAEPDRQPPPLPPAGTSGNGPRLTREPSFSDWMTRSVPRAAPEHDDWAELDDIFRRQPDANQGGMDTSKQSLIDTPQAPLRKKPARPATDPLDDIVAHHTKVAAGLQRAINTANRIASGPSPISWGTALLSTFTQKGKRRVANALSARYAELKGLAGEMEQLLQQSESNKLGAAPQDKLRSYEKAIRADWAAFQTQRVRPQAQRLLSAIQAELSSLQSELAKLSKQLR